MTNSERYIMVETKPRRWVATVLLAILVLGSVAVLGAAAFTYVVNTEESQNELLQDQRALMVETARHQDITARLNARAQHLLLKTHRTEVKLQLCAVRPKLKAPCKGVWKDARRLTKAIAKLERKIQRTFILLPAESIPTTSASGESSGGGASGNGSGGGESGEGGTTTTTATIPVTVPGPAEPASSPTPHVGQSDNCPPNNPHCEEGT